MNSDILECDATEQARLIADGEISAGELIEASISRIESYDGQINAVTQRFFDEARKNANGSLVDGPFRGVPFLVKDFYCHMKGKSTTGSARLLKDNVIDHDSELMRRYRQAGFVTLGKTNVPEMVSVGTTEPAWRGATRNPWNHDHTPGGSSGGASAAVAAHYVAAAHDARLDALLFPTTPVPAIEAIDDAFGTIDIPDVGTVKVFDTYIRNTDPGANAGLPGLTIPIGATEQGLRVGIELDGPVGSDRRLLGIGLSLEAILAWRGYVVPAA